MTRHFSKIPIRIFMMFYSGFNRDSDFLEDHHGKVYFHNRECTINMVNNVNVYSITCLSCFRFRITLSPSMSTLSFVEKSYFTMSMYVCSMAL